MNMKKEYRRELRQMIKLQRKVTRDANAFFKQISRQIAALQKKRIVGMKATNREADKIQERINILQGRIH